MLNEARKYQRAAILAPLLAAAAGLAAPALLHAEEAGQQRVQVSDLNLYSYKGQRSLERRVRTAIDQVCASPATGIVSTPGIRKRVEDCRQKAWEGVQLQLEAHGLPPVQIVSRR